MKIYVASSWRNHWQPVVVADLEGAGHEVYDFRNPPGEWRGFNWSDIDEEWQQWDLDKFIAGLNHPTAKSGFVRDYDAMKNSDCCIMVLPCGSSAHLEAGYFVGAGKPLYILHPPSEKIEPELMYKMATLVTSSLIVILDKLGAGHG